MRVSRKVISNRKFGSGGILQAGRLQARPVNNSYSGSSSCGKQEGDDFEALVLILFQSAYIQVLPSALTRRLFVVISQVQGRW